MSAAATIPLRFQRAELEQKADLTAEGLAALADATRPDALVGALHAAGNARDAVYALSMILPHRQTVWWACLAARLLPDLAHRPADSAALDAAERWVQTVSAADAEQAGAATETCDLGKAPGWAAMAAYWAGPSIAPRGQHMVAPAVHLPGAATRTTLLMLTLEPSLAERATLADWLEIGVALMKGGNGRQAQANVKTRLFAG
ncbi:hypothetical protein GON01_02410 [Sphingomonas sp. MAH-20]|uniref:Uncharacterized protein n=1 Tax=Sphingomonas horti TaxID=2682842 RepID=A0A6I4IXE8_9SPHN|nr:MULTISPECIES: hypothetical protein [Sphingomonas]MBA2920542.1 hypothetical protein [Sphingomonas sp. CGMCC 1.13658]MVO76794.1 hypothetical protein [Sphingomonas horti]